jgi:hypothetical protein
VPPRVGIHVPAFAWPPMHGLRLLASSDTLALASLGPSLEAFSLWPPMTQPSLCATVREELQISMKIEKHNYTWTKVLWTPFAEQSPTRGGGYCFPLMWFLRLTLNSCAITESTMRSVRERGPLWQNHLRNEGFISEDQIRGFSMKWECTNTSHKSIQYNILSLSIVITH